MHINLCETTLDEVERLVKEAIEEKNISPFQKGSVINVEMREALGGDNLKSISLSFRGLTIQETHDILKTKFTQEIIGKATVISTPNPEYYDWENYYLKQLNLKKGDENELSF